MKLLLISPLPPTVGGISIFAGNLIDYLRSNPNGFNLIVCNSADKIRSVVSESTIVRLFTGIINSFRIYFEVRKIIRKERPQLIHLASSASLSLIKDILLLNLAGRHNIPVITHWHFGRIPSLADRHNWEWKLLSHAIRKSSQSIVIDGSSFKTLLSAGFSDVSYIPNPIGLDFEQKAKTLSKNSQHRIQGRVIFVGHIIKNKGVYELVEACSLIASIKELILVGPYEEVVKKELLKLATKRDNGIWLKIIGKLDKDHVLEIMENSPLLVLPSYTEGFPLVVIEAMSMGCAVIATNVGAIPEMLVTKSNTPCGVCVHVKDLEELRQAIIALVEDPAKTETLGKNGIERVIKNYTLQKIVKQYEAVWKESAHQFGLLINK
jgi:glycosyltransferase involved in cell wall biosynthesis